jgi:hypothetical protein
MLRADGAEDCGAGRQGVGIAHLGKQAPQRISLRPVNPFFSALLSALRGMPWVMPDSAA